jgi:hypothetical protein
MSLSSLIWLVSSRACGTNEFTYNWVQQCQLILTLPAIALSKIEAAAINNLTRRVLQQTC